MSNFNPPTPPANNPVAPKEKKPLYKRKWFIALAVLMIIGWLAPKEDDSNSASSKTSNSSSNSVTAQTTKKVVLPWYPEGYTEYEGDSQIAWRWLEFGSEYSCSYGDYCWGMSIIAREGCPSSLYAEISILDSGGTNIGFTNDTTSGLGASQKAKLVFETFTPGAKTAMLAKISCY
jgi:hypothetical protein